QPMAAAVARSSMRPGCCLSSSESQDLTVCLLKTREILFQHALSTPKITQFSGFSDEVRKP
ncbi:hypothetical protein ACQ4M4_26670, partial [Leptolyngbya sp. AN02str]|uniref:hypothetical protein n=1 Tax=Leptolyngbya sp. AN02str TaxID=3423363 RepID=UPI003D319804